MILSVSGEVSWGPLDTFRLPGILPNMAMRIQAVFDGRESALPEASLRARCAHRPGWIATQVLIALAALASPQPPVLSLEWSPAAAAAQPRVEWQGEGGVNYELQGSPTVRFEPGSSKFFLGRNETASADVNPGDPTSRFWRVRALPHLTGVGVSTSGLHAGKLVSYGAPGGPVPLRAFGVNYYDAFLRYLKDSNDTSFVQGFAYLQAHKIPVARVLAAGFWPSDWNLYFTNRTEYYRRLDYFIGQAEQHGVGLILDCFWSPTTVGEIVDDAVAAGCLVPGRDFAPDEPRNLDLGGNPTYAEYKRALGRKDSGSNAWIAYYTGELVRRYAASPAVWGWEFGNEYNLSVDHPNMTAMRVCRIPSTGMILPQTSTNLTALPAWTGPDDLIRSDVETAKTNFAQTVRSVDTWRLIMSGDSMPRPSAWHNWTAHTWTRDSRSQMAQVLPVDNPRPMDTVTLHVYPDASPTLYFSDTPVTNVWLTGQYKELLDYFAGKSAALTQALVVGEWGATGDGTTADEKATFHRLMQALIDSGVQLSLLWDFDNKNAGQTASWWVNPGTLKEYQLTNDDPSLWDLEQANRTHGAW